MFVVWDWIPGSYSFLCMFKSLGTCWAEARHPLGGHLSSLLENTLISCLRCHHPIFSSLKLKCSWLILIAGSHTKSISIVNKHFQNKIPHGIMYPSYVCKARLRGSLSFLPENASISWLAEDFHTVLFFIDTTSSKGRSFSSVHFVFYFCSTALSARHSCLWD